jgi:hypothetical protein
VVLSPEEEREFWSVVGANDVSREKLTRVLDRSFPFLNLVFFLLFCHMFKGDFWDF